MTRRQKKVINRLSTKKGKLSTLAERYSLATFQLRTGMELSTPSASYGEGRGTVHLLPDINNLDLLTVEKEHIKQLCQLLRLFDIKNPGLFLERWTRDEIYTGLDRIIGLEKEGYEIYNYSAFLWSLLEKQGEEATT